MVKTPKIGGCVVDRNSSDLSYKIGGFVVDRKSIDVINKTVSILETTTGRPGLAGTPAARMALG